MARTRPRFPSGRASSGLSRSHLPRKRTETVEGGVFVHPALHGRQANIEFHPDCCPWDRHCVLPRRAGGCHWIRGPDLILSPRTIRRDAEIGTRDACAARFPHLAASWISRAPPIPVSPPENGLAIGATASGPPPAAGRNLDIAAGAWHGGPVSVAKMERLRVLLRSYGSCLVAYSGGVDSAFLALVAHQELGARALAVIADSPSLPRRELGEALELAARCGFAVRVVHTGEFANPNYLANPVNRCYFCKTELFHVLAPLARAEGFAVIAYGENASDIGDFRPGAQAAAEFAVCAPLKEAGLTKAEIREWSAALGLPTADKPQMACLSSRVPYGEAVTPEKLRMIEQAENVLRDLGFHDVRVRHHELGANVESVNRLAGKPDGAATAQRGNGATALARIEVGPAELRRFLEDGLAERAAAALKQIGYAHVTVDLLGYRRGSLNEGVAGVKAGRPASAKPGLEEKSP